ncbi:MAG: TlyA family RNA methyltransferase [Ardenticatenia bacterium]|nr:TlyA family RNA methyltransferase [Ardenticatenia bacterium]
MPRTLKERLDVLLVRRGLAESRTRAQRLIMAGEVSVDGRAVAKPGVRVPLDAQVTVRRRPPYVSRGGLKLSAALDRFGLHPAGLVVADVGASTGGFTDVLLQRGAARVYAIDVGYGQLAWKLRQDPRVVVMERTNARRVEALPEQVDLVTVDVSFISLRLILPSARKWLRTDGDVIALVKPQFEAGREHVGKGGVVWDPAVHRRVLRELSAWARSHRWRLLGMTASPLRGPAGNVEFFLWLSSDPGRPEVDVQTAVERAMREIPPQ